MKFIVFGLGHFGAALSVELVKLGHEVIGVDAKLETIDKYKHSITQVIALDAASKEAVAQLPLKDVDAAIVSIGEDEGANIMTAALLKQMNVARIICRVTSPLQQVVLEAMDIQELVYPEASSAERLALKLDIPGVLDSFQINSQYRLLEVQVPGRYVSTAVEKLDIGNRYNLVLVSIMKEVPKKNIFGSISKELKVMGVVPPQTVLEHGDVLLLFGSPSDLEIFIHGKK